MPPLVVVLLLLFPQAGCRRIKAARKPSRVPTTKRRFFTPTPNPSKLSPPTGNQIAKSAPPLCHSEPLCTGRAVVEMFSVVVAAVFPEIVTEEEVKVPVAPVGREE